MATSTLRDDPDVKIPAAVRAQAERAQAMFDQANGAQPEPAAEEIIVEPPAPPDTNAESLRQDPANPVTAQQEPETGDDEWEDKYKAMHGRVKGLLSSNQKLTEQVNNLQNIIAAMQSVPDAPSADLSFEDVSEDDRREYGEDLLRVVGTKAMKQLEPVLKKMQDRLDAQSQTIRNLSGKQSVNDQNSTNAALDKELPEWREINTNDEFLAWLALPDPYSGAIRLDMLTKAYAAGHAPRVLAFFNGFLSEKGAKSPVKATAPDPSATRVAKIQLADLAAPGRAKAAPSAPAEAPATVISRQDIAAFYADVAAGKYRGRDAEKDAAEAILFAAQRDGRIR